MTTMQDRRIDVLEFQNLGETLLTEVAPPKMLIDDLIYAEGIHSVYSPGGTGKTILALWTALQAIQRGLTVCYIDEENGSYHVTELLKHMGADAELVGEYFKYAPAPGLTRENLVTWGRTIGHVNPALVVFDSFADHLALEGLSENSSIEVTSWIKDFAQPVKDNGGAVLILDHVAKDSNGKGARGSTAKLAKVDVAWKLSLDRPFSRNTVGKITVSRDKDRIGVMPYSRSFKVGGNGCGDLTFTPDGVEEAPKQKPLTGNNKKAYEALAKFPDGAKATKWEDASDVPKGSFFRVIRELVNEHEMVTKDEHTGRYHALSNDYHDSKR